MKGCVFNQVVTEFHTTTLGVGTLMWLCYEESVLHLSMPLQQLDNTLIALLSSSEPLECRGRSPPLLMQTDIAAAHALSARNAG